MQWMSPSVLLRKRMSKGTLEEEDKLTQEDVQKKSKIIIIIKNNNNNKNIRENRNISLKKI